MRLILHRTNRALITVLALLSLMIALPVAVQAQSGVCDPTTPFYIVNLSSDPDGSFTTPQDKRKGNCCGTVSPDRCIEFSVTLAPGALGIAFDIYSGAVPSGSMFYQVNCGPLIPVGQPVCLPGTGPHIVTFCKPGNNPNEYIIRSIPPPFKAQDNGVRIGCSVELYTGGLIPSTITWNDVTSGTGTYNSLLSCTTGCSTTYFNPVPGTPDSIDYEVCGMVFDSVCNNTFFVCDTLRVNVYPELVVPPLDTVYYCSTNGGIMLDGAAIGGFGNYTYAWTDTIGNLISNNSMLFVTEGVYRLEVRDDLYPACPADLQDIRVMVDMPAIVDAGADTTICSDAPVILLNGTVSNVSGATWSGGAGFYNAPDSFLINSYLPTAPEVAGQFMTITLTSRPDTACPVVTDDKLITFQQPPMITLDTESDVSCFGVADGSVNVSVSNGITPYTYIWSHGPTTEDVGGMDTGSYQLVVIDNLGCTDTITAAITQPDPVEIALDANDISCKNGSDGNIMANVSGGTPGYTYQWSNGVNTPNNDNLIRGNHQLTVLDANGCQATADTTLTEPVLLEVAISGLNVNCNGATNGTYQANPVGGVPPYNYAWSTGETTQSISGLAAGPYSLSVTDSNGCLVIRTFIISEPSPLVVSTTLNDVSCNGGSDGTLTTIVGGGVPPYAYVWSSGGTNATESGLPIGTYTVTITDNNGCTITSGGTINEPTPLVLSLSKTDVTCNNGSDGTISSSISGGTAPYTYSWSNGANISNLSGLPAGSYGLTATDANGCEITDTISILQPGNMTLAFNPVNASCNGGSDGSVDLQVSGGIPPYTYLWSNGANSEDLNGVVASSYFVTVTDNNGCVVSDFTIINEPSAIVAVVSKVNDVTCFGANDGALNLTVSGGIPPYSYTWSNGETTQDVINLSTGVYFVTVNDINNCIMIVYGEIFEPTPLTSSISAQHITCLGANDGSLDLEVSGGVPPYSYNWSTGSGAQDVNSLYSGIHQVTITDANGCILVDNDSIIDPDTLVIAGTITPVSCRDGSDGTISLTVSGGWAPYTYQWSNGATSKDVQGLTAGLYAVTVTDNNNCVKTFVYTVTQPNYLQTQYAVQNVSCNGGNDGSVAVVPSGGTPPYSYLWSNGNTNAVVNGLSIGSYEVTITDLRGCFITAQFNITEPAPLNASATYNDVSCFGSSDGAIDMQIVGGTAPYGYAWSNGATSQDLVNLGPGLYEVTITDDNACTFVVSTTIAEPTQLTLSLSKSDVDCFGNLNGAITSVVGGGVQPYSYSWSNGDTASDALNLGPGTYQVTVTDANGCTITGQETILQPNNLTLSFTKVDVDCYGYTNGQIDVSLSGGIPAYSYSWSTGDTTQDLTSLPFGNYHLTVTDKNGCAITQSVSIDQPTLLQVNANFQDITCFGDNDGMVDLSVVGGTTPYSYIWTNGAFSQDINGLSAGTYSVTVTDANGCSDTLSRQVIEPAPLTLILNTADVTCFGDQDAAVNAVWTGGMPRHRFLWNTGATTSLIGNLAPGTYSVTVTDGNGCQIDDQATVTEPSLLSVTGTKTDVSCFGFDDAGIDVTATGGIPGYGYVWSNVTQTEDQTNIGPGTYSLTITDQNGCNAYFDTTIVEPADMQLSATLTDASCNGGTDGGVDITVAGGMPAYSYNWSTGHTGQDLVGVMASGYQLTVTDQNNCEIDTFFTVNEPAILTLDVNLIQDVSCFGGSDGILEAQVTGGVNPNVYQWSNGDTTQTITSLSQGFYFVRVLDQNGCQAIAGGIILQPKPLAITATISDVTCNGNMDGEIEVAVAGGTGPYSYQWSVAGTDSFITGLDIGSYGLTVTDANGCVITRSYNVSEPAVLTASASMVQPVSCTGGNDGIATVGATGGTPPYAYIWSSGDNSATASNLAAGTYQVTVSDQFGCSSISSVVISEPFALDIFMVKGDVNCNGGNNGRVVPLVSGGIAPYSFSWSNGSTDSVQTNLTMGGYSLTVTDVNGCTFAASTVLYEPTPVTYSFNNSPTSCYGGSDGAIDLTVSGGVSPYTYGWNIGSSQQDISGLAIGSYSVFITDANGCITLASTTVTQPDSISFSAAVQDVSCFGGSNGTIALSATGGVGGYGYQWTTGFNAANYNNVAAGTYGFTITDANGCDNTGQATVGEPSDLIVIVGGTPTICSNSNVGRAEPLVIGGVSPYTYNWSNGVTTKLNDDLGAGTYQVTVTDANGCVSNSAFIINELTNTLIITPSEACIGDTMTMYGTANPDSAVAVWEWTFGDGNAANGRNVSQVYNAPGPYTVQAIATLQSGCKDTTSEQVTLFGLPTADAGADQQACYGLPALLSGSGGSTYQWEPSGFAMNAQSASTIVYTGNDTEFILTVTDANGCKDRDSVFVDILPLPVPDLGPDEGICLGDSIQLQASGGAWYHWVDGDALNCATCSDPTAQPTITNEYIVEVTDINGCIAYDSLRVDVNPLPPGLSFATMEVCEAEEVVLSGANGSYTYDWSPKNLITNAMDRVVRVDALTQTTTFTLVTTNQFGCVTTDSTEVMVNPLPTPSFPANVEICAGDTAFISPSPGYFHVWTPLTDVYCQYCPEVGLYPGTSTEYTVATLSDKNCLRVDTIEVLVNQLPFVDAGQSQAICDGDTYRMDAQAAPLVSYDWVPGNGVDSTNILNPLITPTNTITYTLTVTDSSGCVNSDNVTLRVLSEIGVLSATAEEICEGDAVTLRVNEDSIVAYGVEYTWYNSTDSSVIGTGDSITISPEESIGVVLIADAGACQPDTVDYQVTVNPLPEVNAGDDVRALMGQPVTLAASADSTYLYEWAPADSGMCVSCPVIEVADSVTTTYTITVTDENGCRRSDDVTIYIFETCADEIYIPNSFTPNGDGLNDVFRPRSFINYGIQEFRIFDRWGNLVFETDNLDEGWDGYYHGSRAQADVYVYYLRILCDNGTSSIIKGNVTLIR